MKKKIIIICKYERWCVNWFNDMLRYLATVVYDGNKSLIVVNKRNRCICIPEREITFISESQRNNYLRGHQPDKIVEWDGDDINILWDLI